MADDPYETLGVKRDATDKQIRAAYRKLAKKYHPDLNPGDKRAEERFKAVASANDLLSDPEKRARFDRGEIDAAGQQRPEQRSYRNYAEGREGPRYGASPGAGAYDAGAYSDAGAFSEEDMGDILSGLFGARGRGKAEMRMRGADRQYSLAVNFLDAVQGATRRLVLPDGASLDVRVPPGIEAGQVLRLKGQGGPGHGGGPPGDALIEIQVSPHPFFRRDGNNILLDLPVTLGEAALGGRVTVPTASGSVAMNVPEGSDTGTRLRLRGKGVPAHGGQEAGDQYVTLRVMIGPADEALQTFLRDWAPQRDFDPRREITEGT